MRDCRYRCNVNMNHDPADLEQAAEDCAGPCVAKKRDCQSAQNGTQCDRETEILPTSAEGDPGLEGICRLGLLECGFRYCQGALGRTFRGELSQEPCGVRRVDLVVLPQDRRIWQFAGGLDWARAMSSL